MLRGHHGAPPRVLRAAHVAAELFVEQQIREFRFALVSLHDRVEEDGANDATAFPDARHLFEIDLPVELLRADGDQVHPLRVRTNLRRIQSIMHSLYELLAVAAKMTSARPLKFLRGLHALVFH